jgi:hypothetical protein
MFEHFFFCEIVYPEHERAHQRYRNGQAHLKNVSKPVSIKRPRWWPGFVPESLADFSGLPEGRITLPSTEQREC